MKKEQKPIFRHSQVPPDVAQTGSMLFSLAQDPSADLDPAVVHHAIGLLLFGQQRQQELYDVLGDRKRRVEMLLEGASWGQKMESAVDESAWGRHVSSPFMAGVKVLAPPAIVLLAGRCVYNKVTKGTFNPFARSSGPSADDLLKT